MFVDECTVKKIDISNMENKPYTIGRVTNDVIELLGLAMEERDIVIWGDRISHIERHKKDFEDEINYHTHIELIPDIIANPDFVSVHPNGQSIEYIKKIDEIVLVAVRIKVKGRLALRTAYPIKQTKLDSYIESGRAKRLVD